MISYFLYRYGLEQIIKGKYVFEIYDIAGGEKLRNLWRHYYEGSKALVCDLISFVIDHSSMAHIFIIISLQIFMVDSTNKERFPEAKEELKKLIQAPELFHLPVLVLSNKTGMIYAINLHI